LLLAICRVEICFYQPWTWANKIAVNGIPFRSLPVRSHPSFLYLHHHLPFRKLKSKTRKFARQWSLATCSPGPDPRAFYPLPKTPQSVDTEPHEKPNCFFHIRNSDLTQYQETIGKKKNKCTFVPFCSESFPVIPWMRAETPFPECV